MGMHVLSGDTRFESAACVAWLLVEVFECVPDQKAQVGFGSPEPSCSVWMLSLLQPLQKFCPLLPNTC
jgi:hypothetical protein